MAIGSRVRSLERQRHMEAGQCRLCGGKGKLVVTYIDEGEPTPKPNGCSACGRVTHIVVEGMSEELYG